MTHSYFNHLLSSIKGLSADQARQCRQQLYRQLARSQPSNPGGPAPARVTRRAKPAAPKKPLTRAEFNQHLLKIGLISSLPDPSLDIDDDDPDDQPVTIKGEPL